MVMQTIINLRVHGSNPMAEAVDPAPHLIHGYFVIQMSTRYPKLDYDIGDEEPRVLADYQVGSQVPISFYVPIMQPGQLIIYLYPVVCDRFDHWEVRNLVLEKLTAAALSYATGSAIKWFNIIADLEILHQEVVDNDENFYTFHDFNQMSNPDDEFIMHDWNSNPDDESSMHDSNSDLDDELSMYGSNSYLDDELSGSDSDSDLDDWIAMYDLDSDLYANWNPVQGGLPRAVIDKLERVNINGRDLALEGDVDVCAVCLEEFTVGTELVSMPCSHLFHELCIVPWLERKNACPICRRPVSN